MVLRGTSGGLPDRDLRSVHCCRRRKIALRLNLGVIGETGGVSGGVDGNDRLRSTGCLTYQVLTSFSKMNELQELRMVLCLEEADKVVRTYGVLLLVTLLKRLFLDIWVDLVILPLLVRPDVRPLSITDHSIELLCVRSSYAMTGNDSDISGILFPEPEALVHPAILPFRYPQALECQPC